MRLLLVDVGNTKLKWRFESDAGVQNGSAPSTEVIDQVFTAIAQNTGQPDRVALSCVKSPAFERRVVKIIQSVFGVTPFVAHVAHESCGLVCSYADPSRMGVDRWLAMIAVKAKVNGAFCVVDSGSAVTLDWVSASGKHVGGFIVAGLRLSIDGLLAGTDQVIVDYDKLSCADIVPGASTTDAVYNGALFALVAQVNAAYDELVSVSKGGERHLILTGGDAKLLSAKLKCPHQVMDGLVFDGLKIMMSEFGES